MCENQGLFPFRFRPELDFETADCDVTFYDKCQRYIEDDVPEGANPSRQYRECSKGSKNSRCPHEYVVKHVLLHFIAFCYPAP